MWELETARIKPGSIHQYHISRDGSRMTFEDFLAQLAEDSNFREYYNSVLANSEFDGFFWENYPISKEESTTKACEFVLVEGAFLKRIQPEPNTFSEYFEEGKNVVAFPNLRGDAQLIVPTPKSDPSNYTHLGNFVRNAPAEQRDEFWKLVGEQYKEAIKAGKRWLSTAGLGVYWLHVRIDERPKYYRHGEYKFM